MSDLRTPRRRFVVAQLLVTSAFALTSCSGGGQSPITGAAATSGAPSRARAAKASASLHIVVPAVHARASSRRGRAYVSSNTASIQIALTPTSGSTGTAMTISQNLSSTATGCAAITGGGYSCTITLPSVAVGAYTIAFTTYDGALDGSGNPTGNVLSANQTFPFTVVANTVNVFGATLDGIPTSIAFLPVTNSSLVATPATRGANAGYSFAQCAGLESPGVEAASVYALDADGNEIIGPGAPTFTLTSSASSVVVGTPTAAMPNLYPLGGPTTTANFGTPGSSEMLTATATTPAATASGGGVPTSQVSLSVGLTLVACSVVNVATDASPGTTGSTTMPPGAGPGAGSTSNGLVSGDLRYVLQNAPAGARVVFALGSGSTTVLTAAPLPPIEHDVTVDGDANVVIDGGNATAGSGHRIFFVDTGTVVLRNLTIANALAQGGNGGSSGQGGGGGGGGGGCGCGAGLFVNQAAAAVSIQGVTFSGMSATGGSGGSVSDNGSAGGGGGLGFAGGDGGNSAGSGGGGGVLGAGTPGSSDNTFTGGMGGYGGGGYGTGDNAPGAPGAGYGSNAAPTGINGTFGGGGGGDLGNDGGAGGFGGGGGGGFNAGGAGGFGAGGGGSNNAQASAGGPFGGSGGVESSGGGGGGGGGAALGAAVFVNFGSLTTVGSSSTVPTVTAGAPGTDLSGATGIATGGQSDITPVFNHAGTVNGASPGATNGAGVPGAL